MSCRYHTFRQADCPGCTAVAINKRLFEQDQRRKQAEKRAKREKERRDTAELMNSRGGRAAQGGYWFLLRVAFVVAVVAGIAVAASRNPGVAILIAVIAFAIWAAVTGRGQRWAAQLSARRDAQPTGTHPHQQMGPQPDAPGVRQQTVDGAAPAMPPPAPTAGWYVDPENAERRRFFDGAGWTERVAESTTD